MTTATTLRQESLSSAKPQSFKFSIQVGPTPGLTQILYGTHHVAWLNDGGDIGGNRGGGGKTGPILQDLSLSPISAPSPAPAPAPGIDRVAHYGFFEIFPMTLMNEGNKLTTEIQVQPDAVRIIVSGTDALGYFKGCGDTTLELDPERSGKTPSLRIRQSFWCELLQDLDASAIQSGKQALPASVGLQEVPGMGPCWVFELNDPFYLDCRGPATPMDRDFPYRVPYASNECFTKAWHNKYDFVAFEGAGQGNCTLPLHTEKLVLTSARYTRPLMNGGWAGLASKTIASPMTKINSNEQPCVGICQWIYDVHFISVIPFNAPRDQWNIAHRFWHRGVYPQQIVGDQIVLKAGLRIEMNMTTVLRTAEENRVFLSTATYQDVDLEERGRLENCPALNGIKNDFTQAVTDLPDAAAWKPASEAIWDRTVGHATPGSLRICNNSYVQEGAWAAKGGRSNFGLPIVPGHQYKLSGWIKTHNVGEPGATIEIAVNEYVNLGRTGERQGQKFRFSTKPLTGSQHWTYVETIVGPFPEDCTETFWIARLKGHGVAWFDEIAFEIMKKD